MRYIGELVKISPKWEDVRLIWVTNERDGNDRKTHPSFWFEYNGWIYYGVVQYKMNTFETYDDWEPTFNNWAPEKYEFELLTNFKSPSNLVKNPNVPYDTLYYKVDYEGIMKTDLDYWCEFEMNFLKEWNREKKINDVISPPKGLDHNIS